MIITHADQDNGALCGSDTPDSSGYVATSLDMNAVDCVPCLDAAQVHVCGVSDLDRYCSGCRVLAGDAGLAYW